MTPRTDSDTLDRAAEVISTSDAILITAGAGMGVDSGLPDFRGNEGFWNAYPPYRKIGKSFVEMANPENFSRDPAFGWGFYGHRMNLYRQTEPHAGFQILREWTHKVPLGYFVMTSNVDGHFQRAGFDETSVYEVHGSIFYLQCSVPCSRSSVWEAGDLQIEVNPETMMAEPPLPDCPKCGAVARPNILMFGDWGYVGIRNEEQNSRLRDWLRHVSANRVCIIELGAGTAVPTVRLFSEGTTRQLRNSTLIRINLREPESTLSRCMSIGSGAFDSLSALDERIRWQ